MPTSAATGRGRCDALLLLSDCFYLLRAFFCAADVDALFPRERALCSGGPAPVLLPDAVLQGALRIEHGAWAPVHSACLCREAHLRVPQPHYTLCTLERERRPDRPSIYRLLSEHDGRLMLVAQQPAPGEDFLLFSADAIDLLGAPASSSADAVTPPPLPLDEHSAHYRGAVW